MASSTELLFLRLEELKQKSFSELLQLPSQQQNEIISSDGRTTIAVWKDALNESELRVVVQAYQPGPLGVGRMQAAGFRATQHGIKDLEERELADFT